jgi:biotin carboxyl carrier protein
MKMQNELRSPKSGTVMICNVEEGTRVSAGDILLEIE